jgi:Ca2+-binding EF-hand superfamily protein
MKRIVLSGKGMVYFFLFSILLFAASCANHTQKESVQQKLEQEPKTVKKEAVTEEKQDSVMFQKKLAFFKKFDVNNDKKISEKEYLSMAAQKFASLDADHNGKLTSDESDLVMAIAPQGSKSVTKQQFLDYYKKKFQTMDKNKDKYVTMEELDVREN